MMKTVKRSRISDLNDHLTCKICKGYFIDATTIVECLHTFCRSCIVKYLESNKYCPICEVQVHKNKPLLSIKRDKTIQDVVYKLVPRLFQNEMQRRKEFYDKNSNGKPSALEQSMETQYQYLLAPEECVSLTLNYFGCHAMPRYLRCPAMVSIAHLHRLIRAKYDLNNNHRVEILYNQDCLNSSLTLMDVAYIYMWKKKCPIDLSYRIYECTPKKPKLEGSDGKESNQNNNTWREVQLRISENGEMSITGIHEDLLNMVENNKKSPANEETPVAEDKPVQTPPPPPPPPVPPPSPPPKQNEEKPAAKKELPPLKYIGKTPLNDVETTVVTSTISTSILSTTMTSLSSATTTTVFSTINTIKCSTKTDDDTTKATPIKTSDDKGDTPSKETTSEDASNNNNNSDRKRKSDSTFKETEPKPKQIILNHSIGLLNLSNNHPLKKHSLTNRNGESESKVSESTDISTNNNTVTAQEETSTFAKPTLINKNFSSVQLNRPGTPLTLPQKTACYMPKNNFNSVLNVPKPAKNNIKNYTPAKPAVSTNNSAPPKANVKAKPGAPIGYKTLRDPPKSWNSQISKANISKSSIGDPKNADLKNARPPKFFKMRNNVPRFLGNPASGVKPMYQVHVSPEKEKNPEASKTTEKSSEIKRHSIVKIDPKTLKPISEKAPDDANLSHQNNSQKTVVVLENKIVHPEVLVKAAPPQADLKINTSSVSIFNPLKNHSSPKNDRKSPKSPGATQNSIKTTANSKPKMVPSASIPSRLESNAGSTNANSFPKRDSKPNLSFTPPNPFIPNLASPTMNPNQFLFSGTLPAYDPRIVAAYHSLWYGQRMAFNNAAAMASLNLDLNQRKLTADTSNIAQTSPKVEGSLAGFQLPSKTIAQVRTGSPSSSSMSLKKPQKESGKMEKSLHTTVEKLVQNRTKEIVRNNEILKSQETVPKANPEVPAKPKDSEKAAAATKPAPKDTKSDSGSGATGDKNSCSVNSKEVKQNSDKANVNASTGEGSN